MIFTTARPAFLLAGVALAALVATGPARAADTAPAIDTAADVGTGDAAGSDTIVVTGRTTRSVTQVTALDIQKVLPGVSPLKAIQTLPGVTFLTADPWGNNEQNISLFVHGFNAQQLGYTLDGVPLGDQTYGNYNGLSPQRAIISENVGRVTLASGAGDLGTASTSNLGGTIDTFSSDPTADMRVNVQQTVGSHDALRTFGRIDSGTFGNGNSLYVSGVRQKARAWDFRGKQGGYQANAKFVHEDATGTLTLYGAYSDKTEPNEDATVITVANRATAPYTRPFFYPDFAAARDHLASGAYKAAGSNYRNYYSDAQRTDYLAYAKYDWAVSDKVRWSNQTYYHHNDGVGVVAGPIDVAGLPQLFSFYFPATGSPTSAANLARLTTRFGGSGFATRTTEYRIDRGGLISRLQVELGDHKVELGGWYERQSSSAYRRWYALDVNAPSSPYTRPRDEAEPLITQYGSQVRVNEYQAHIQDSWRVVPSLTVLGGVKATIQSATQRVPVQPIPGSFTGSTALPEGRITTKRFFLPQIGALWDVTGDEQIFVNAQKNIRQFQTSAAAGLSPFALGSQAAFELFRDQVKPETSWTYEAGLRTSRTFSFGPITGFQGQVSYYHVDFSNRLLGISPNPAINAIVSGAAILQNVGSVRTDGVDIAGTLRFGPHFSLYNALSYNNSTFRDDYTSGVTIVRTAGKNVPGSPKWLNKTVATANVGIFDAQLIGDYLGRRFATFTNDLSVRGYYTVSARLAARVPLGENGFVKDATVSVNVTNLTDKKGTSTLSIGAASGTFNAFPLAPRQVFGTVSLVF
ncbi:TonB-dependent receptor [Sphingomonas solaris]|uniref:TonB-dependent receptor n=1 Tax=Alterirhizorhabdus solaris TaxID=2529389 RepID=A0A558R382_9SPHN|nr:TonB-dependent receptor plug domain-containing protein [Sphingomonas solaris]TVV73853.1 TonB-dependent receptor [Sphingomonas solaris]